jgi:hypothetical protein
MLQACPRDRQKPGREQRRVPWLRESTGDGAGAGGGARRADPRGGRSRLGLMSSAISRMRRRFIAESGQEFRDWVSFDWQRGAESDAGDVCRHGRPDRRGTARVRRAGARGEPSIARARSPRRGCSECVACGEHAAVVERTGLVSRHVAKCQGNVLSSCYGDRRRDGIAKRRHQLKRLPVAADVKPGRHCDGNSRPQRFCLSFQLFGSVVVR